MLESKCLKWVWMSHLDIWNTSYGQKKGWESNWQFDFWPLKVKNQPYFHAFRWHATYHWKALDKGYNFSWDLISIGGLHAKLWGPKVARVPILPNGSPGTKCYLDVGFVEKHRVYYKGEDGSFPQVQAVVSLVSPSYPWLVLASKVFQICTNHLVFNLCRSMWVVDACHSSWSHPEALARPSTPKVLWAKERAPTLYSFIVFSLDSHLNSIRSFGTCQWV
jgi:hypothetical protein